MTSFAGCGGTDQASTEATPAAPVRVTEVEATDLSERVRGIGTLRAAQTVELRPEVSGRIEAILFEEGARVDNGASLFELDASKLRQEVVSGKAELESTKARRDDAQRRLRQTKRLYKQDAASEDELDSARNALRSARADVERLESELALDRERLSDAQIKAPFAGLISESQVDVGDFVEIGRTLATLYEVDELDIAFTLPERYAGRVESGQSVKLTVAAHPNRSFQARVFFVSPEVDEATRDFLVKANVDNPNALLKPGSFATAAVTVATRQNRPVVPEEALVATREGYFVFVVGNRGVAQRRDVEIGLRNPGVVEIVEGIEVGDRVIASGHMRVADGADVRIINPSGGSSTSTAEAGASAGTL